MFTVLKDTHKTHIMKKTVTVNGQKVKVDFSKENHTRVVDEMQGIQISKAHGTVDYIIDGTTYQIEWSLSRNPRRQRSNGVKLHYKGFSCPENEKKMIEHILNQ